MIAAVIAFSSRFRRVFLAGPKFAFSCGEMWKSRVFSSPGCAAALPPTREAPPFRAQRTARAQVCAGPSLALGRRAAVLGRVRWADPRRPYGALRHDPGRARQQAPTSTLSCIVQYNIAVYLWEAAAETRAAAAAATACVVAEPGPEPRPGRGSRVAVRRFPGSRRGQPPEHAQSPLPRQQSEQRRLARRTFKQHCPAGACTVRCGGVPDSGGARCGTTLVCPSNRGVRHPRRNQKLGAACWVGWARSGQHAVATSNARGHKTPFPPQPPQLPFCSSSFFLASVETATKKKRGLHCGAATPLPHPLLPHGHRHTRVEVAGRAAQ